MLKIISQYPNGTFFKVSWRSRQIVVEGILDTIYETDNGLSQNRDGKMKFRECDTVRILKDYGDNVKKGEIGAILVAFEEPVEAYEVEFLDAEGYPKAQCTLLPDDLEEDKGYQEYFACSFKVNKIIQNSYHSTLKQGQLIEISIYNSPTSIELKDGTVIWQKADD